MTPSDIGTPVPEEDRPNRTRENRIADLLRIAAGKLRGQSFSLDASLSAERKHNLGHRGYDNIPVEVVERATRAALFLPRLVGAGLLSETEIAEFRDLIGALGSDEGDPNCA